MFSFPFPASVLLLLCSLFAFVSCNPFLYQPFFSFSFDQYFHPSFSHFAHLNGIRHNMASVKVMWCFFSRWMVILSSNYINLVKTFLYLLDYSWSLSINHSYCCVIVKFLSVMIKCLLHFHAVSLSITTGDSITLSSAERWNYLTLFLIFFQICAY